MIANADIDLDEDDYEQDYDHQFSKISGAYSNGYKSHVT